ncbi:phosphotransferase [Arsenicicoccus dermatophilus]|uniref:phosphotransferase n=1 Tax=Arsenicicoccus dermatophilus TaxID=1076331 RepID=UPI00391766CE
MTAPRRTPLQLSALASAAVKGLDPVGVQLVLGEDDRCDVAWVEDTKGRRWTIRVPRTAADAAQMESAAFLLPQLDKRLPFAVPVEAGSIPLRDSGRAMVYPHLEGRNLDFARLPAGPGIAAALGRAVAHVHNLDPLLYDESGVPSYDADACRSRHLVELDRVGASGHIPSALMSRWERALENVACWRFASVPLHGRLSGELVVADFAAESDSATGRVVAVTGWDQARVGDPAEDFGQLWGEASPEAFDTVLEAYSAARQERPDRALEMRAQLLSELRLVRELSHAMAADDAAAVDACARDLQELSSRVGREVLRPLAPETTRPGPVGSGEDLPDETDPGYDQAELPFVAEDAASRLPTRLSDPLAAQEDRSEDPVADPRARTSTYRSPDEA